MSKLVPFGLTGPTFEEPTKEVLGGKGFGLVGMADLGIPVPPGVIVTTDHCVAYYNGDLGVIGRIVEDFFKNELPKLVKHYGYIPLLSVRSGARVSMPGMMDTILNVGLTTDNGAEWQDRLGTDCVLDCRSRLKTMYADVVGSPLPDDLTQQLTGCVKAVFDSWMNDRAIEYRRMYDYSDNWGTAVIIQSMVFGNMNDESCSGVAFTRNPATGENKWMGEFLPNAQGEDVVAGTHTPLSMDDLKAWNEDVFSELCSTMTLLEHHYADMQDIEFTVQDGDLYILQTRDGKRLPKAAFQIAVDMVEDGTWDIEYAVSRLSTAEYLQLSTTEILDALKPDGTGIAAGGTIVIGKAVFTAEAAVKSKEPCILIREETDPDDVLGMAASVGILTKTGGKTSHAAVVSRGFGKTCVCGLSALTFGDNQAVLGYETITEGSWVAIDGETGNAWFNQVPTVEISKNGHIGHKLMRLILDSKGLAEVGTKEDLLDGRSVVIKTATWEAPSVELAGLIKFCKVNDIDKGRVLLDLRDDADLNTEDEALFALTSIAAYANEKDRITCAEQLESSLPQGSGFKFLTETYTNLPGVQSVTSLSALMKPGVITVPASFGTVEEVQKILHGLELAGHETPVIFGGVSRLDEVAFDVLD